MATEPKRYDMRDPEEIRRWFREMEGYLKTEDFIRQGTDREGRIFAMDGFRQLRMMIFKQINRKDCSICINNGSEICMDVGYKSAEYCNKFHAKDCYCYDFTCKDNIEGECNFGDWRCDKRKAKPF